MVVIIFVPIVLILLSLPISQYINNHLGPKPITSSGGCKSGPAPGKLVLNSKNKLNYLNMTSILEQYDLEYMTFRRNDEISFSITVPVGEENFALLVGISEEHDHEHCDCGCEGEDEDVIIAKIVKNEAGEDEYIEPTDDEFDAVQKAYDAIMDAEEE